MTEGTADQALSMDTPSSARQRFKSAVETPELAQGPEQLVVVRTDATIARGDLAEGLEAVVEELFGRVPAIIRPQVREELQPEVDRAARGADERRGCERHRHDDRRVPHAAGADAATGRHAGARRRGLGARRSGRLGRSHPGRSGARAGLVHGAVRSVVRNVMRVGGIGPVPFSELQVAFSFPASERHPVGQHVDRRDHPVDLPGITSDVHFDIDVVVDGTTMVLTSTGTVNQEVQGQEFLGGITGSAGPQTLTIEPAPAGMCAPQPTPTPDPTDSDAHSAAHLAAPACDTDTGAVDTDLSHGGRRGRVRRANHAMSLATMAWVGS